MCFLVARPEMVVGWYHSHPGFGCWLSGVDINTQQVIQDTFLGCPNYGTCGDHCVVLRISGTGIKDLILCHIGI